MKIELLVLNTLKEQTDRSDFMSSFEQAYRAFWKKIYIICYKKLEDSQLSEELVQEIFISLWKSKTDLSEIKSIENYLVICAKNKIMDHYRKSYAPNKTVVEPCGLCTELGFDEKTLAHNEGIEKFLMEDLELVVNQLPCICQKVYRLSREENMTTNEIASHLGISQKTVKNHITKALAHIKSSL